LNKLRASPLRAAVTLTCALAGALLAMWLGIPLPWFTGPLLAVAGARMSGIDLPAPPRARDAGQWIIGAALGLYFTPEVTREVLRLAPWIALNLVFVIALGLAGALALHRSTGEDGATSFFAMAIGGASEMAAQAERHGVRVDRVAAAHSLRIMLVALIVPFTLQSLGVHGVDVYSPAARDFNLVGFIALAAVTGGGAIVLLRLNAPNAWMIGPLLVAGAITAGGQTFSALPTSIVNAGQLLIGVALGARFSREFFRAAPRYLSMVALITLGYLAAAASFGWALAFASDAAASTMILATTPGGIGEMAITAKVLQLGAPIVSAFHAIRMAAVVLTIGALYRGVGSLLGRQ
jgi:membrane AbrB-like protein